MTAKYRQLLTKTLQVPLVMTSVLMYAWIVVGLLYTEAPRELAWAQVSTYHKLLLIPLVVAFLDKTDNLNRFWIAILASLVILQLIYLADLWVDIPYSRSAKEGGIGVFNNYIVEGLSLATLTLLGVGSALWFWNRRHPLALVFVVVAALALFTVLFLNPGRGAQLALVAGLLLLVYLLLPNRARIPGLTAFALTIALLASQSDMVKAGFERAVTEAKVADTEIGTSVGRRINAWKAGVALWTTSPLIGHGPGSYEHLLHTQKSTTVGGCEGNPVCLQPHSQYVLLLAEQGLVGFLIFIGMLAALIWPAFKNQHLSSKLSASFACLFAIHSAFDSGLKMGTQMFIFVIAASALAATTQQFRTNNYQ